MRALFVVAMVLLAACATGAPQLASAQPGASTATALEACVTAATALAALEQCKGVTADLCLEQDGAESTAGMIACFGAEGDAWEALLDGAYARRATDDPERRALLGQARSSWEAWRQAQCAYDASEYSGGSFARAAAVNCWRVITADQAIALIWAERTE